VAAIKNANKSIDIVIFRVDRAEIEATSSNSYQRNVVFPVQRGRLLAPTISNSSSRLVRKVSVQRTV
jgi:hypothetical protein